jgi:hypothetical protein
MSRCSPHVLLALTCLLASCAAVPNAAPTPTTTSTVMSTVAPTAAPTAVTTAFYLIPEVLAARGVAIPDTPAYTLALTDGTQRTLTPQPIAIDAYMAWTGGVWLGCRSARRRSH